MSSPGWEFRFADDGSTWLIFDAMAPDAQREQMHADYCRELARRKRRGLSRAGCIQRRREAGEMNSSIRPQQEASIPVSSADACDAQAKGAA
jgi:hypothetical protein